MNSLFIPWDEVAFGLTGNEGGRGQTWCGNGREMKITINGHDK